jgi:hypothetical protein
VAVHERGSHGSRGSVAPLGAERLGLLESGPGAVVVVVELVAEGAPVVVVEEPGTVVVGVELARGFTTKLEPATTTTSGATDEERAEPTSIVLLVVEVDPELELSPFAVPVVALATSPGS